MSAPPDPALDRGGHLSHWALERLRLDPRDADPAFFASADAHLAACAACRALYDQLAADEPALRLAPPLRPAARVASLDAARARATGAHAARRRDRLGIATAFLAAAAALVVATRPADGDAGVTRKGTRFDFEVHVHDGRGTTLVDDGATVHAGEHVGFKVRGAAPGWLMVFGWDDRGAPYPAWPAGALGEAIPLAPATAPTPLPAAIALDGNGTRETFAAVWCTAPFTYEDVAGAGASSTIDARTLAARARARQCTLRVVHLVKRAP